MRKFGVRKLTLRLRKVTS